jgi:hypothetical protein
MLAPLMPTSPASLSQDPHHARVVVAIVNEDWAEVERLLARRPLDPVGFVAACRAGDVLPGVHALLQRRGRVGLVGREAAEELARARHKCRVDNLVLLARAERALDVLLAAGVVPVALKGLDLLHRVYAFDERTVDDVDLLVPPHAVPSSLRALEAAGWTPPPEPDRTRWLRSSHHLPLHDRAHPPVELELHWSLVQRVRYRLDPAHLFARALPLEVAGRKVLRLDDHDAVAHLLLHHLSHYFDRRLKWALDLRHLASVPGFSWSTVADRIEEWGGGGAAGLSLMHLAKLVPSVVTPEVRSLFPLAGWRRAMTLPLRSRHPLDLFRWTGRRGVRLYLAGAALESPARLPGYLWHRARRISHPGADPDGGEEEGG